MKETKYKYLVCIVIALLLINIVLIALVREVKLSKEKSSIVEESNQMSTQMNELNSVLLKEEIKSEDIVQSRNLLLSLEGKWQDSTLTSEINSKLRLSLDAGWEVLTGIEEGKDINEATHKYEASVKEYNKSVDQKLDQINKKKLVK